MEKFTMFSLLLDIYGNLLKGKRREVLNLHYNEDYSLAEIAQEFSITRQGVRDFLLKGEKQLLGYEENLGILKDKLNQDQLIQELIETSDQEKLLQGLNQLIYYAKEEE